MNIELLEDASSNIGVESERFHMKSYRYYGMPFAPSTLCIAGFVYVTALKIEINHSTISSMSPITLEAAERLLGMGKNEADSLFLLNKWPKNIRKDYNSIANDRYLGGEGFYEAKIAQRYIKLYVEKQKTGVDVFHTYKNYSFD